MKNTKLVVPVLLLLAVTLSCKLVDRLRSRGEVSGDFSKVAGNLANYDPKDPPPSPGAAALRQLAELEPSVGKLVGDVEAAERAALKTGLAELRAQRDAGNGTDQGSPAIAARSVASCPGRRDVVRDPAHRHRPWRSMRFRAESTLLSAALMPQP